MTYPFDPQTTTAMVPLDDMSFGDDTEEVVQPTLEEHPRLMWMTGNLITTELKVVVGWHVRCGVNPVLDKLLNQMGVERYTVEHKTGNEPLVPYWNLSWGGHVCSFIVIASGVKSPWQMKDELDDRDGVAYGVGTARDDAGNILYRAESNQPKQKPQMQLRAFIHELVSTRDRPGFDEWFKISVSNYSVDFLYDVLNAQFLVLNAYDASMIAQGKSNRAKYWGFSIPTVIGKTGKKVGPDKDHKSTIIPMVAQIPPMQIKDSQTIAYLNAHRIPEPIQNRLRDGLLLETKKWSKQRSLEIVVGQDETVVTEEPIEGTTVEFPQLPPAADLFLNEEQVNWVRDTYCGNEANTIKQVCQHFRVADLAQLRVSQYTLLYDQLKK